MPPSTKLLTGRENLELVGLWYHLSKKEYRARAQYVLERFSLTEAGDKLVKTYSGGMRRRLDIGASLIGRPPVLFLDEPTTGLDPRTRNEVWEFVEQLVASGTTVLLTTQYMEEAERLAHQIVVMSTGTVVARGTAYQLKDKLGGRVLEARVARRSDLERATALLTNFAGSPAAPRREPANSERSRPDGDGVPYRCWAAVGGRAHCSRRPGHSSALLGRRVPLAH